MRLLNSMSMNTLYFGDNLEILKRHISDESVDLIYLDPPFNSNRDYNILFREQSGTDSPAQIKAFGDTWNWAGAAEAWADFANLCPVPKVIELMQGFHNAIGENDVLAYLVMMAPRLYHLHRVLKPTGSLYLHCDPTASAYLRLILDCIFSPKHFGNEIIWQRTNAKGLASIRFARNHDVIFRFTKTEKFKWFPLYTAHTPGYLEDFYRFTEEETGRKYTLGDLANPNKNRPNLKYEFLGVTRVWRWTQERMQKAYDDGLVIQATPGSVPRYKRYLDEQEGNAISDVWTDIRPIQSQSKERLGYPTQKPIALLERIVAASSAPGDVVLDPFCGCGTAIAAAQKLDRNWVGIDITPIATTLVQKRLFDAFGAKDTRLLTRDDPAQRIAFATEGLPTDLAGAKLLYDKDLTHKDFEMWAVGLIPAIPQEKKGSDRGIDGVAYFYDTPKKPSKAVVQVKGGHVTPNQIRDLIGVMMTEKAQLGFFVTLESPTKPMKDAALAAGYYQPPSGVGRRVEALQIRTIEELLTGNTFDFPLYGSNISYLQADRVQDDGKQGELML